MTHLKNVTIFHNFLQSIFRCAIAENYSKLFWHSLRREEITNIRIIKVGDKIEKNEMGGACSTYGGEERCIQGFGGET